MKKIYSILIILFLSTTIAKSHYWEEVTIPTQFAGNYWLDVYFLESNPDYGWICGYNGAVLRTTNRGASWQGALINGGPMLESVSFVDSQNGYASGSQGIFKTIDGGQTWTNVTPSISNSYWGCYFLTADYGMVVGEGCLFNQSQKFWLTTNGGTTWSLYEGNEPGSGMTDVILTSENGPGYAVSSGNIWRTDDGGKTWAVMSNSGSNVWQEEITISGQSILVPYAGNTCQGGGNAGGLRYTTDFGNSWTETNLQAPFFGSYLLSPTEGWGAGQFGSVYHTENSGQDWLKKTCAIDDSVFLDDIWFISKNEGWVVGSRIFKMSEDEYNVFPEKIEFDKQCVRETEIDTVWIENKSFDENEFFIELTGETAEYTILQNAGNRFIEQCGMIPVVIRYEPQSTNSSTAYLDITVHPGIPGKETRKRVTLEGKPLQATGYPEEDLIEIDELWCNTPEREILKWNAETNEDEIVKAERLKNEFQIRFITTLPHQIWSTGSQTEFDIITLDTGWIEEKFKFHLWPCNQDTIVTIRAYGVSPIINSEGLDESTQCAGEFTDTIPVFNTGNKPLKIDNSQLMQTGSEFSYSWIDKTLPFEIPVGDTAFIEVIFATDIPANYSARISITNNDSTKARGDMNPYFIDLKGQFEKPELVSENIDFGTICIGAVKDTLITLENIGNSDVNGITYKLKYHPETAGSIDNFALRAGDSRTIGFQHIFDEVGEFLDTLLLIAGPCNDTTEIAVRANVISNKIIVSPDEINASIKTNEIYTEKITVVSESSVPVTVTGISLSPDNPDWDFSFTPQVPVVLSEGGGQQVVFTLNFSTTVESELNTQICVETDGICAETICIPVKITALNRLLVTDRETIEYGLSTCGIPDITESVEYRNVGGGADTIVSIELANQSTEFSIINTPALPFEIPAGESLSLNVRFNPSAEGSFTDTLILQTLEPDGQVISIPLSGEYKTTKTEIDITEHNFGTIEQCDDEQVITVTFTNSGMLDDILVPSQGVPDDILAPDNFSKITVPAGGSATSTIRLKPGVAQVGFHTDNFDFVSEICPKAFQVVCEADIIHPRLTIEPTSLDFGDVWMDESRELEIRLRNESDTEKEVVDIRINPQVDFENLAQFPMMLEPGDDTTITIRFNAISEGLKNADLKITERSVCVDETNITLHGNVPVEYYFARVRIDSHEAPAGEIIQIPVILETPVDRFKSDFITFALDFDMGLFYPKKLLAIDGENYTEIPIQISLGRMTATIEGETGENLFKKADTILIIEGLTLLRLPSSTPLEIASLEHNTNKDFDIDKRHGHLEIIDFCEPIAAFTLQYIPQLEAKIENPVADGQISIIMKSTERAQDVSIQLVNMLGKAVSENSTNVTLDETEYTLNVPEVPAGFYLLRLMTENGQKITEKIIIRR